MLLSLFIAVVQQLRSDIQQDIAHLQLLLYTAFQTTTWNALVVYITTLPCQTSQQQNLHTYTHTHRICHKGNFFRDTQKSPTLPDTVIAFVLIGAKVKHSQNKQPMLWSPTLWWHQKIPSTEWNFCEALNANLACKSDIHSTKPLFKNTV